MVIQGRPSAGAWLIARARLTVVAAVVAAAGVREQRPGWGPAPSHPRGGATVAHMWQARTVTARDAHR